jgi:cell division protein FtsA
MVSKTIHAVGLDAGGSLTRCVICALESGRVRLLGYGEAESHGWLKGGIADQNAAAESIRMAVREAERMAEVSVESTVVGVGGAAVRGANARGVLELGHAREIEQRDVNRAVDRARRVQLQEDRMVLQLFPQEFVVEGHPGHRDPRHMFASRLDVNVHLITASVQEHTTLIGAVNQAHLSVEETVFEPLAGCYAAVLPEERREGIALVDIGAQSTDLVVFYGDALHLATGLPVSGDHFSRDVARGLTISYEDAELVKREYGCATSETTAENSFIELPAPGNREPKDAPRRLLNAILEARAEELFQYVRRELARVSMDDVLFGGVVLVGGGARLPGMCDVAERVLNCQARNGLTIGIQDWPDEIDEPGWTTVAGLAMYSARLKMHGELERQSSGLLGRILK